MGYGGQVLVQLGDESRFADARFADNEDMAVQANRQYQPARRRAAKSRDQLTAGEDGQGRCDRIDGPPIVKVRPDDFGDAVSAGIAESLNVLGSFAADYPPGVPNEEPLSGRRSRPAAAAC